MIHEPSKGSKRSNSEPLSTEEEFEKLLTEIGGVGRFQVYAFIAIVTGMNATGYWFYMVGYLMQAPVYTCTFNGPPPSDPSQVCTAANICAGDSQIATWQIDYANPDSLHNWQ